MRRIMKKTRKAGYGLLIIVLGLFVCVQPTYADELKEETVQVELLSEGAIVDAGCQSIDALRGEVAWESGLRSALTNAFDGFQKRVDVSNLSILYSDKDKLVEIYRDVIDSNGRYFYLSGSLSLIGSGGKYTSISFRFSEAYLDANGNPNVELIRQHQNAYDSRVQEILSYLDASMTDLEKITFLHDFIVRECDYDYDDYLTGTIPDDSYAAYGVLVKGTAVCQGYALAFRDLALRLDIPCIVVSSNSMNHAWNMVQLDGKWYHIDATWDDPVWGYDQCKAGYVEHDYFLLSDEEMLTMEHYGWSADAPQASQNGSYQGYIFRKKYVPLNYHDGKWYWLNNRHIVSGNLDGSQYAVCNDSDYFDYFHMQNGIMYLANDTGIYQVTDLNANNVKEVKRWASDATTQNKRLYGFAIINRTLVAEFVSNSKVERIILPKKEHKIYGPERYKLTTWSEAEQLNISKGDSPYEMAVTVANPEILSLDKNLVMEPKAVGETTIVAKVPGDCLNEAAELVIPIEVTQVFADVSPNMWYDPFVEYVYENNIMSGKGKDAYGNNLFDPSKDITRAEVATVLYNMEKKPNVAYTNKFPDVVDGQWYSKPISWAYQNNVVSGYATGQFGVADNITREQMAQMLYAYARMKGYDISYTDGSIDKYSDSGQVSDWAKPAMNWAITQGIMSGKGSGSDLSQYKLDPLGKAIRAESATMLKKFAEAYVR